MTAPPKEWTEAASLCMLGSCVSSLESGNGIMTDADVLAYFKRCHEEFSTTPSIPFGFEGAFQRALTAEYIRCTKRLRGELEDESQEGESETPQQPPPVSELTDVREICRKKWLVTVPEVDLRNELTGKMRVYEPEQGAFFKKVPAAPGSGKTGIQQIQSQAQETWNRLKAVRMPSGELSMPKINVGDFARGAASNAFQQAARSRALMPVGRT
ncbi:MAG: hypothetical protein M1823_000881 [Watsoniomyces obsoletus]|nr:MAG: hypothetical protein M1823_000881 [Watsoniomyces obsoletus]